MGISVAVGLVWVSLAFLHGQSESPERHSLYYVYTALSKPIEAPGIFEFIGMGVLDDRKIDYYNSKDKMKIPQQKWMEKKLPADYWEKGTQSRRSKEQWFKVNVNILMERMRQNGSDVHVLNWRHGCEVGRQPDGSFRFIKGVDQYSYDGRDFLSFDDASMQWVAPVPEAIPTKQKWDGVPILNQYTKGYLEKECVDWLSRFMNYSDETLDKLTQDSPPEVHLFAKTSKASEDKLQMTCLATGFYPKEIDMFIRKKGSHVRTVVLSDVHPNGDGTHQARLHLDVPRTQGNDYDCYVFHRTLKTPIIKKWETDGIVCDESSFSPVLIVGAPAGGLLAMTAVILTFKKKASHVSDPGFKESQDSGLDSGDTASSSCSSRDTPGSSSSSDKDSNNSTNLIV